MNKTLVLSIALLQVSTECYASDSLDFTSISQRFVAPFEDYRRHLAEDEVSFMRFRSQNIFLSRSSRALIETIGLT